MARSKEPDVRKKIVQTAQKMSALGLSPGTSGNVSQRWGEGMLITPSALSYDEMEPGDIVFVDGDGSVGQDARKPSTEWPFHQAVYQRRADAQAIVHCHSVNATALACAHEPIPAFHYMVAVAGGSDIPLVPYASFGTKKLASLVQNGVKKRDACLLANHGQIALGKDLDAALNLAFEVEVLADQYVRVLSLGRVNLLSDREMAAILRKFAAYRSGT